MDDLFRESIKSKSRFNGNYKEELAKLIELLDESFENATGNHFVIDSSNADRDNIRLRISDPEYAGERIVNCVFWYHHGDMRYGYVSVDLVTTGHGKKPEKKFVGKFLLTDHETIKEAIWKDLISVVQF